MSTINLRNSKPFYGQSTGFLSLGWRPAHWFPAKLFYDVFKMYFTDSLCIPRVIPVLQESGPDDVPDDLQPAPAAGPDVSWPCMRSVGVKAGQLKFVPKF